MNGVEDVAGNHWMWGDRLLWSVVGMFILGSMARALVSNEPFDIKKFTGEVMFSLIGAVLMYSAGLMQGMTEIQMIGFGALSSLGGVRMFEWFMQIVRNAREVGVSPLDGL